MRIQGSLRYFFRWPLPGNKARGSGKWERWGQAWWPELAACYMLTAQKRVGTLTPVRPLWRRKPKVVAGLAERGFKSPYLRNYVVARINPVRFHRAKKGDTKPPMTLAAALVRIFSG